VETFDEIFLFVRVRLCVLSSVGEAVKWAVNISILAKEQMGEWGEKGI